MEEWHNMEKEKIIEIINDVENKSNKDLFITVNELYEEFEKTKQLIVDLTRNMESIEKSYNRVNKEIEKRVKK
jgi:galactitol-specific phosphotransferase system IIB component